MLSLSRGGQLIWMSDKDAAKVGIADNDWIEAVNRNGVVVARAVVSHRMPEGTVYMHHAQDRLIDVPIAETSGKRGGIHNSVTRAVLKPMEPGAGDKAPDYRVLTDKGAEIGAVWRKQARSGAEYFSVKLDDPSLVAPIHASLVAAEEAGSFNLMPGPCLGTR